jgi:DNA mismatch endonuclease (patch repair protein)
MLRKRSKLSFKDLSAASPAASRAAKGSSTRQDTRCEMKLRRELFRRGCRYRLHYGQLPGRPDIVFPKQRVVIFCDGDFWHGRDLKQRLKRLTHGHNGLYWTAKIKRNSERDLVQTQTLEAQGWTVLRFWETEILGNAGNIADRIEDVVRGRTPRA